MDRRRAVRVSLGLGLVGAGLGVGFGVVTGVIPDSGAEGVLDAAVLLVVALSSVPFALAAGSSYLALRHRVLVPLVAVVAAAGGLGWGAANVTGLQSGEALVVVLLVGPPIVVVGLLEALARARLGRLAAPPTAATWQAVSIGVMAALLYAGVFALRAVIPLSRIDTGVPSPPNPTLQLALTLWYVMGAALVLVGVPVALNRRYGLVAPAAGLLGFLAVDLAFVQPAVAGGSELVVALVLGGWPVVAVGLAAVGALEWWLRARRGEYDEEGPADDGGDEALTVEGGPFGDRV
jgi:hypothetical protein